MDGISDLETQIKNTKKNVEKQMTGAKNSGGGEPIISVSGLRGVLGSEFTPRVAIEYAAAFCGEIGPGPVLLSRDGRTSGSMLCDAIASAILACGRDCLDIDVAATPTVGVAVGALERQVQSRFRRVTIRHLTMG